MPPADRRIHADPGDVDVARDEHGCITGATLRADGTEMLVGGIETMSKSTNNGVDPQAMVDQYGADPVRLVGVDAGPESHASADQRNDRQGH